MSYDPEELKRPRVKPSPPGMGERCGRFDECCVGDFVFEGYQPEAAPLWMKFERGPWRSTGYSTRRTVVRVS